MNELKCPKCGCEEIFEPDCEYCVGNSAGEETSEDCQECGGTGVTSYGDDANKILLCSIIDDWEDKIVPWTSKRYLLNDFEIGDHVAVETFIQGPDKFAVKTATGILWFDDADEAEKAAMEAKPTT